MASSRLNPRLDGAEPLQRCAFPECRAACCLYGAWVDKHRVGEILAKAEMIGPHLPPDRRDPNAWFDGSEEPDPHTPSGSVMHTTVMTDQEHYGGSACIFMRPDYKCAMQTAAEANGLHPWRFKPFFCILHPLDLDEHGRITLDLAEDLLAEPASCLRPADSHAPLKGLFSAELDYLTTPDTPDSK